MKRVLFSFMLIISLSPVFAETTERTDTHNEKTAISDENEPAGFLTEILNKTIAEAMPANSTENPTPGRTLTGYASAPKFGGYFIGKYAYSNQKGKSTGDGFSQRLVRVYVDGTILKDFAYRIQMQTNNDKFHMKDFFLEWRKYPEFKVKIGQYKRAFGLENPMNPWDVGNGDYSQLTKKLTGHGDYIGDEAASNGGRDQGIQVQGDLFPMKDGHRFVHYQVMISNGQGINCTDKNSQKDVSGTLQFMPTKSLMLGFYGWTGNYTNTPAPDSKVGQATVKRNRYEFVARYEANDWTVRAEYAHSTGHKISDYLGNGEWKGTGKADAWYATVGIPCNSWLKTYLKYDVYRDDATWNTTKTIYAVCPNIQLHKNLMFQPQLNYVHDRTLAKSNYCELWTEIYVRF